MKITLRQLQLFVFTAKYGSISKAAASCYTSQPAATMALRQLESVLGTPLFDRIGKRLLLNSDGQVLLPKAGAIVDQTNELEYYLHGKGKDMQGEIRLGASLTLGHYVLPSFMASFKALYPNISFRLTVANTQDVLRECEGLNIDIGVVEGGVNPGNIETIAWKVDELVVIARAAHPLTKKKRVNCNDLGRYPWVMREAGSGTEALIAAYAHDRFSFSIEAVLTNFEAIKRYVAGSDCLSCISYAAMESTMHSELCKLCVDGFKLIRPFSIIRHQQKFHSRASDCFQAYLLNKT